MRESPRRASPGPAHSPWFVRILLVLALPLATCSSTPEDAPDAGDQVSDMSAVADLSSGMGPTMDALCASACAGQCVDLQNDPKNCGTCGNACGAMQTCAKGVCSGMPMTYPIYCNQAPPAGAKLAAPAPAYSGGTCPKLVPGENTITSMGNKRTFRLAVPTGLRPDEVMPVVFLWYWLGGSSQDFLDKGEVQPAVDQQRFLAVVPDAKGDLIFKWPFNVGDTVARQNEEFKFFDDMLACVSQQFNINHNCVGTAGVSAGALFTDQLAGARSQYLSSGLSLSGGVGQPGMGAVKPWVTPQHRLPMLVLWGGPLDICIVINFQDASHNLEAALTADGDFILECIHNCHHGEPPFDPPPGMSKYAGLWRFVFDHPFWLAPGDSPYKHGGIPADAGYPSWCAVGAGKATPRTGMCPKPGC